MILYTLYLLLFEKLFERLGRNMNFGAGVQALFSALLLFPQLHFARAVSAIEIISDVFPQCGYIIARDNPSVRLRLYWLIELLAR